MTEWLGCSNCVHFKRSVTCAAYPNGIPIAIASGEMDHLVKRPGQVGGVLFKAKAGAPVQSRFVWAPGDVQLPLMLPAFSELRHEDAAPEKIVEWKDEGYLESKG